MRFLLIIPPASEMLMGLYANAHLLLVLESGRALMFLRTAPGLMSRMDPLHSGIAHDPLCFSENVMITVREYLTGRLGLVLLLGSTRRRGVMRLFLKKTLILALAK